jgi:4-amino-4-deoxy-L-arabinose transferase-like glycosyltransferase
MSQKPTLPVAGTSLETTPLRWGPLGRIWRAVASAPPQTVAFAFVMALGAAMLLPLLGAVGFYDCWESHYAEVAREMVARDDYVHPHWKDHFFFSKPVLLFWMTAAGFKLLDTFTGTLTGAGNLPELTELAARLPVALIGLLCLMCVYRFVTRFFGRTAGVFASVALVTMPFFALVARQHITDMPFVGFFTAAICLMAEAFFGTDEEAEQRVHPIFHVAFGLATLPQLLQICRGTQLLQGFDPAFRWVAFAGCVAAVLGVMFWVHKFGKDTRAHLFYVFCALATLAKGLPGILLPGLVFMAYTVTSWEWARLRRVRALTGTAVLLLIAAPWYVVMSLFTGKDDEGKTFVQRFWIQDHLNRFAVGVHGERGTFEYYVKQLGVGTVPWVGLLPFAWLHVSMPQETLEETRRKVMKFIGLWALVCFGLFSISTTKFHHYILPMVPPLAMCAGIYLADLWEQRKAPPMMVVLAMLVANVVLGLDLARNPHLTVDMFTYHYVSYKPDYYMPRDWNYGGAMGGVLGVGALLMVLGAVLDWAPAIRETLHQKAQGPLEAVRWAIAELVDSVLWLGETAVGLVVKPAGKGRTFAVACALAGWCPAISTPRCTCPNCLRIGASATCSTPITT